MGNVVRLSVHRNTKAKRKRRETRDTLRKCARGHSRVAGYVLISWDENLNTQTSFDTGGTVPINLMPDFIKTALTRLMIQREMSPATAPDDTA